MKTLSDTVITVFIFLSHIVIADKNSMYHHKTGYIDTNWYKVRSRQDSENII